MPSPSLKGQCRDGATRLARGRHAALRIEKTRAEIHASPFRVRRPRASSATATAWTGNVQAKQAHRVRTPHGGLSLPVDAHPTRRGRPPRSSIAPCEHGRPHGPPRNHRRAPPRTSWTPRGRRPTRRRHGKPKPPRRAAAGQPHSRRRRWPVRARVDGPLAAGTLHHGGGGRVGSGRRQRPGSTSPHARHDAGRQCRGRQRREPAPTRPRRSGTAGGFRLCGAPPVEPSARGAIAGRGRRPHGQRRPAARAHGFMAHRDAARRRHLLPCADAAPPGRTGAGHGGPSAAGQRRPACIGSERVVTPT